MALLLTTKARRAKLQGESSRMPCHPIELLGAGGQGEVYRATLGGRPVALKWYFPRNATPEQRRGLERLVKQGPPDSRFLWPAELVSGAPGFGYVMPLREARFKSIVDLMKGRIDPSFRALLTAGFQLADSFLQLHSRGLCYRDVSFGNVFFDPSTGDIRVCDNDNVGTDGVPFGGILGTPRFMAPEVVRGEAPPSSATDLWSLAVLLFYMLTVHHPLEGARELAIKCMDLPAMTRLYGTHPLFVFHPTNPANAPTPGWHDNVLAFWPLYPDELRSLFVRSFVNGAADPSGGRVRESEWRGALLRARDRIGYCRGCSAQCFFGNHHCWSCRAPLRAGFRLVVDEQPIMLNHDTQIFAHHTDAGGLYNLSTPVAQVTRHPNDPTLWGLKNLGAPWTAVTLEGRRLDIATGRSVSLASGTRINFGTRQGEIRG